MKIIIFLFGTVIFLATTANAQQIDGGVFSRQLCISQDVGGDCPERIQLIDDVTCVSDVGCGGLAQTQLNVEPDIVAAGSVGYSGPSLVPNISAFTFVPPEGDCSGNPCLVISSVQWGFQRYTLNGNQAIVNGQLTFSRDAQAEPSFSRAAIIAFRMESDIFDLAGCSSTLGYRVLFCLRPDFAFATMGGLLTNTYQEAEFEEFAALGPAVVRGRSNAKLTITGSPGDQWFIGSYLHFRNTGGNQYFDSRNTVAMNFEDPASVQPSLESSLPPGGTAVPAPAPGSTSEQLYNLKQDILALNVQQGISNALDAKMQAVERVMDDLNQQNDVAAINSLTAFIYFVQAQRGNQIEEADADMLIATAIAIISSIGG